MKSIKRAGAGFAATVSACFLAFSLAGCGAATSTGTATSAQATSTAAVASATATTTTATTVWPTVILTIVLFAVVGLTVSYAICSSIREREVD